MEYVSYYIFIKDFERGQGFPGFFSLLDHNRTLWCGCIGHNLLPEQIAIAPFDDEGAKHGEDHVIGVQVPQLLKYSVSIMT